MQQYEIAEEMYLKGIQMLESIPGTGDYELACALEDLANLYVYNLKQYEKAEQLYLKVIKIVTKLLGPSCSQLEFLYSGIIEVRMERLNGSLV